MRVIGGRLRGFKLKKVPGEKTRPVTDRVKENLFNILGDWVRGTDWLDLYAGTGQVGIEALSRGASSVVFVDNSSEAVRTITQNLQHTRLEKPSTVIKGDAARFLKRGQYQTFNAVYVAPPQYKEMWIESVQWLDRNIDTILELDGLVIVQIDPKEFQPLELERLILEDQRKYGRTMLCFYHPGDTKST